MTTCYTWNITKKLKRNRCFATFELLQIRMQKLKLNLVIAFFSQHHAYEVLVVQWLPHLSHTQMVPGSIPGEDTNFFLLFLLNFAVLYHIEGPKLRTTQFSAVFSMWQAEIHLMLRFTAKTDKNQCFSFMISQLFIIVRVENSTELQRTIFGHVLPYEIADFCTKNSQNFCHNY